MNSNNGGCRGGAKRLKTSVLLLLETDRKGVEGLVGVIKFSKNLINKRYNAKSEEVIQIRHFLEK